MIIDPWSVEHTSKCRIHEHLFEKNAVAADCSCGAILAESREKIYSQAELDRLREQSVKAEREASAKIAEEHYCDLDECCGHALARMIRARGTRTPGEDILLATGKAG